MKYLCEAGYAASTIKSTRTALSDVFRYLSENPAKSELVKDATTSARKKAPPPKQREPLTRNHLLAMSAKCHAHKLVGVRDFFAILLAYRGFLRGGEVTALFGEDIELRELKRDDPVVPLPLLSAASVASAAAASAQRRAYIPPRAILILYISSSKTNPQTQRKKEFRAGETVIVGPDADQSICSIAWYHRYSALRSAFLGSVGNDKPLFFSTARDLRCLNSDDFNQMVKTWLGRIKVDPSGFGGHSARAGGATAAAAADVDIRLIKRQGRWKSDAVYLYIHDDTNSLLPLHEALGALLLS
jgi:integrase